MNIFLLLCVCFGGTAFINENTMELISSLVLSNIRDRRSRPAMEAGMQLAVACVGKHNFK